MQEQRLFNLTGIDVRAAGNDDILGSIFQREEAVIVH
jgi:hypothetical protein